MTVHNTVEEQFSCYCLQTFSTKEISKRHIKIDGKKMIKMPKKGE